MSDTVLELAGVAVEYGRRGQRVRAVDGVDLTVARGEIVGLVGESGCGKSTLARAAVGLEPLAAGAVTFEGQAVTTLGRRRRPDFLRGAARAAPLGRALASARSAKPRSRADWKRCSGSFSRQRRTIGSRPAGSGSFAGAMGPGSWVRIALTVSAGVARRKGGRPPSIS